MLCATYTTQSSSARLTHKYPQTHKTVEIRQNCALPSSQLNDLHHFDSLYSELGGNIALLRNYLTGLELLPDLNFIPFLLLLVPHKESIGRGGKLEQAFQQEQTQKVQLHQ